MSSPLTNLNVSAFTLSDAGGAYNYLGLLKMVSLRAANDLVDARGLTDRFAFNLAVKQGQAFDFVAYQASSNAFTTAPEPGMLNVPATNLDITAWDLNGSAFLGRVKSGTITAAIASRDQSALADAYKSPVPLSNSLEISADLMTLTYDACLTTLLTGGAEEFTLAVTIAYGPVSLAAPMVLKSGRLTIERDAIQLENAVLHLQGTPTVTLAAGSGSLLATILTGNGQLGISLNTGAAGYGDAYQTSASGSYAAAALLSRLTIAFAEGALIEQRGTLEVQGPLEVVPN